MTKLYLKPNVVPEPLFDKWYAWSHLISPATAAMNLVDRHIKIMNSYIQAPHIHAAACKNPKMLGGPFMDYGGKRVDEIKALKDNTTSDASRLVEFSNAIRELDDMLKKEAKGYSLDPLYEKIPEILRGYVELVYDLNSKPTYRFFESILYHSEFYREDLQSVALYLVADDERPFILSTPQLGGDHILELNLPFAHKGWDELFKMKREPQTFDYIKQALEIKPEQEDLFRTFFTEEAPKSYEKYEGEGIRTRYFGHACILVETKDVSILVDPVLSYYGYDYDIARYTYAQLPEEIDYVLITHNHQDHILFETMLQIRHKIKNIVVPRNGASSLQDPNLKLMFNAVGFNNVIELSDLEVLEKDDVTITGFPFIGEHSDLDIASKLSYKVDAGQFSIGFMADACNIEPYLYKHVQKIIGDLDVLFLGMECEGAPLTWLYGPLLTEPLDRDKDQSRRLAGCNYPRAQDLVDRFKPQSVFVYAMGQEPWLNYIMSVKYADDSSPIVDSNKLIKECKAKGIEAERLYGEKEIFYRKTVEA